MRRKYTSRFQCKEPGCPEWTFSEYDTRADQRSGEKWRSGWKCIRHSDPKSLLGINNRTIKTTLVSDGKFWVDTEGKQSSGFAHGTRYRVFAEDVPAGTKLTVTAELEYTSGGSSE